MMRLALAISLSLALVLAAPVSQAQSKSTDQKASALFQKGAAAYARGDFRAAADAFEGAYRLLPAGAAAYNAGLAWQEGGDRPRAAEAYERALHAKDLDPSQAEDAKTRLAKIGTELGRIRVHAPAGTVSVGYAREVAAPITVWVEPGEQRVRNDSEAGESTQRRVNVVAGQIAEVDFAQKPSVEAPTAPAGPSSPPETETASSSQKTWGFVALGAGALAGGAAIYLGTQALSARNQFNESNHADAGAHDRAASLRVWTNVAWGAAIVGGGLGVYLILSAPSGETRTGVLIGPGSVGLAGRF